MKPIVALDFYTLYIFHFHLELITDLSGMSKTRPILSLCIAIVMLSMAGLPPFAGFFGKFYIISIIS